MKIGKFGKVNNVSIDTIRHYMELGLIVPEKQGGQYDFDDRCQSDLDLILELKKIGFRLNEMKKIFHYKNFAKLTDYEVDTYYQSIFLKKVQELEQEIKMLEEARDSLKGKLDQLAAHPQGQGGVLGINLTVLDLLRCVKCHGQLTLQEGMITRNQIIEGKLSCECGVDYPIESGVLNVGKRMKPIPPPINNIPEYIQETDSVYLANFNKGLHWSKRKLGQVNLSKKVILELGSGSGFFLRNIYQDLPEDGLYIAVDHNFDRHLFLKKFLEKTGLKRNILFICADFLELPLPSHSIDIIVDNTGTSNYSFEHETFLLHEVDSLSKPDGYLLGSYLVFKNFSPNSKIEAKYRDNFTLDTIRKNIGQLLYKAMDERISEPVDKGGKFEDFFVPGEEIYSYSFWGKR
ncbi:MerR family transcriptional regulator [Bacillus sp. ISL-18]|uniref:MerR family transcriptional regulator n=1 Tax=Bacillus sp. ISL-18 TaxID=2819118 RepID=UPI001BEB9D31|nr:MerR family transcriptional regulator [Bacillus sp. ISL-18]MBT2657908.1 MerR family transcriptional regulator [Bacillus sp. ISL-18]